jgi:uncharacterized protein
MMLRFLALILPLVLTHTALAQSFPALTGRVVDAANILSPAQEVSLDAKLTRLEQQSKRQLVVATIPDLQGYEIADYGFRLGDHWGVGDKQRDDGVILIVAPEEKRVRIEVGYGLEGILPDIVAGRIIRDSIVPHFKQNDYPGGISAGVDSISKVLMLPPDEARKLADQAKKQEQERQSDGNGEVLFVILFILFFFVLPMLMRGRRGRAYRGGIAPVILWGPGGSGGWGSGGGGSNWSGGGGFSGGGGGFGGGGASGGW